MKNSLFFNRMTRAVLPGLLLTLPLFATWWLLRDIPGYPSNDDPFYGRPAQILAEESRIQVIRQYGELSASSILHSIFGGMMAWCFGFSYRILFLSVILQLCMAALMLRWSVLQIKAPDSMDQRPYSWTPWVIAATLLWNPLVFGHGFTFMTDGPAMAWFTVSLLCFLQGLRREKLRWLIAGSIAAGAVFWIRQTHVSIVGFPVISLVIISWQRREVRFVLLGCLASILPAFLSVLLFESGVLVFGDQQRVDQFIPDGLDAWQLIINVYGLALLMGALCLPLCPWLIENLIFKWHRDGTKKLITKPSSMIAITSAAFLFVPLLATKGRAVITSATGSFLQNTHLGPIFLSDFEVPERWADMGGVDWPAWVWQCISALAILNFGLIVHQIVDGVENFRKAREPTEVAKRVAIQCGIWVSSIPFLFVILTVRTGVLDRYWMPIIPLLLMSLAESQLQTRAIENLRSPSTLQAIASRRHHLAIATTCFLLMLELSFSVVLVRDFLTFNARRWQQYEAWLDEGYIPQDIDGGRDMNAWFRSFEDFDTRMRPGGTEAWWTSFSKVAMSIGPRPGWRETGRIRWDAWMDQQEHEILLLEKE